MKIKAVIQVEYIDGAMKREILMQFGERWGRRVGLYLSPPTDSQKSITFKVIEGDPLKFYNAYKIIFDVQTNGEDNLQITYTLEYEKKCRIYTIDKLMKGN